MSAINYVISEWNRSGNPAPLKLAMLIGVIAGLAWMVYRTIDFARKELKR